MTTNVPARLVTASDVARDEARRQQSDAQLLHKMATDAAVRWMDEIVGHHEKAAHELRGHMERLRRAADAQRHGEQDTATPVEVLSWFVNATKFVTINSRTDLAVNHAGAMALAAAKLQEV